MEPYAQSVLVAIPRGGGLLPLRRAASERNALHGVSREDADAQKKKDARESEIHPHLQ